MIIFFQSWKVSVSQFFGTQSHGMHLYHFCLWDSSCCCFFCFFGFFFTNVLWTFWNIKIATCVPCGETQSNVLPLHLQFNILCIRFLDISKYMFMSMCSCETGNFRWDILEVSGSSQFGTLCYVVGPHDICAKSAKTIHVQSGNVSQYLRSMKYMTCKAGH